MPHLPKARDLFAYGHLNSHAPLPLSFSMMTP